MEGKDNILAELRLISVFVADISRETPYGLPDGYFEHLAGQVLDRLSGGVLSDSTRITPPVYAVPEGYFEGFAEKLMGRIRMDRETNLPSGQHSPEPAWGSEPGASEELGMLSPLLSRIDKKMPFETPQGYFGNLSPLLAILKDKPLYEAPEGYFDALADTVLTRVKEPVPARIISIGRRRNWLKYSAAAAVAGLMLTGAWLWTHTAPVKSGTGSVDITSSLPRVSDQEIENYLDTNNVTNNVLPSDDLANSTASLDITDNDIRSFLGDVPDGELKQYIDENGDDLATN